jgi:hypothetical protein
MNGDRVEAARRSARILLAVAVLVTLFAVLWLTAAPNEWQGLLPFAIGAFGLILGLAWMSRIFKGPAKYEGSAHWRFRDH